MDKKRARRPTGCHLLLILSFASGLQRPVGASAILSLDAEHTGAQPDLSSPDLNPLDSSALSYLQRYGYMATPKNSEANNLISEDSFASAVSSFQQFAGLPATGKVDGETWKLMRTPRCGNQDHLQRINKTGSLRSRLGSRRKRYALQGSKWRRQELTYRISQYPSRFLAKKHEVDSQIERAFGIWSQVAPIEFVVKREGRVHIDIRFASGDHGDGDAFDGPGNTLAHAYFPQYGGDAHFDDQEYWTVDSYAGTNIFQVAAHELGHSLGLGHSNVREALMAPFYQKYKPNFKLHADDVLAIQALYGEKAPDEASATTTTSAPPTTTSSSTTTTTTLAGKRTTPPQRRRDSPGVYKPEDPEEPAGGNTIEGEPAASGDLCADAAIDAATRTEDGNSYVFKGDLYWLLTSEGLAKGYPRRIGQDWEGLPGKLDAALTWADGKTFFFKGNKYWRYRNKRRDLGYPKLISVGFAGIPDNIDAALVWSGNGRTYIFKGADYWRFDSKADPPVSSEYPRPIKVWQGVPAHLDAALKWENNVTYFFKGAQYYRFNDKDFRVETRGRPAFPRPSAEWWFGCLAASLAQRALPGAPPSVTPVAREWSTPGEREQLAVQELPAQQHQQSAEQHGADWSLLAGLDADNSRAWGTHISDHRPPQHAHHHHTSSSAIPSRLDGRLAGLLVSLALSVIVFRRPLRL